MPFFDSDGLPIAYEVMGEGPAIVVCHGFGSTFRQNWQRTGWVDLLRATGRRVIGFDARGHGQSTRSREQAQYLNGKMHGDVLRLMDHLQIASADLLGYSMGAWTLLPLIATHAERFRCAVLGGAGAPLPEKRSLHAAIVATFEGRETPASCTKEERTMAASFRNFAQAAGNDIEALTCVLHSGILRGDALNDLDRCAVPTLVIAGDDDVISGDPRALSAAIPGSRLVVIEGGNHLSTLVCAQFREAILDFLKEHWVEHA